MYSYKVIESIKHDANYFIEGLTFTDESFIVESVGLTGKSKLVLHYDNEPIEKTTKPQKELHFLFLKLDYFILTLQKRGIYYPIDLQEEIYLVSCSL